MPDEEIGGQDGLAKFVLTSKFKEMNVGFGLDEGLASPTDEVDIFYAERNEYWVCHSQFFPLHFHLLMFSSRCTVLVTLVMVQDLWKTQPLRRPGT